MYKCEIITDSLSPQGDRLTTYKVTYPRIIHAEMLRHRILSRNVASSRAIPFAKMVKDVMENPFIPIAWQKDHKGMQGTEYWTDEVLYPVDGDSYGIEATTHFNNEWLAARDAAVLSAKHISEKGLTKQLCNRLLEPFVWTTELISGTEFDNFFNLRCPKYNINGTVYRSKKDAIKRWPKDAKYTNILDWLICNESGAEIHIQKIAEMMWDAYNESTPKQLEAGEWHIPYGYDIQLTYDDYDNNGIINQQGRDKEIKIATARCARLSYETLGDEPKIDYEADIKLHDRLLAQRHMSPFEHCARVMSDKEYMGFVKGKASTYFTQGMDDGVLYYDDLSGWCNNFKGFIQYRQLVE